MLCCSFDQAGEVCFAAAVTLNLTLARILSLWLSSVDICGYLLWISVVILCGYLLWLSSVNICGYLLLLVDFLFPID